jgi:hypothetical protein
MMSEEGQKHASTETLEQRILLALQHSEMLQKQTALEKNLVLRAKIELERLYIEHQMPNGWMTHACVLKRAADAVIAEQKKANLPDGMPRDGLVFVDLDIVYLYLIGAAVENLLKGIYVARCPRLIKLEKESIYEGKGRNKRYKGDGYKLNPNLVTHKLTALAKNSGVELTGDECNLLKTLEKFIDWAGRYRIPKDSLTFVDVQLSMHFEPDGESKPLRESFIEKFSTSTNNLYNKCRDILREDAKLWKLAAPSLSTRPI